MEINEHSKGRTSEQSLDYLFLIAFATFVLEICRTRPRQYVNTIRKLAVAL